MPEPEPEPAPAPAPAPAGVSANETNWRWRTGCNLGGNSFLIEPNVMLVNSITGGKSSISRRFLLYLAGCGLRHEIRVLALVARRLET